MTKPKGNYRMPFDPMAGETVIHRNPRLWKLAHDEAERVGRKRAKKQRLNALRVAGKTRKPATKKKATAKRGKRK